ncbi:YciI family protein [Rhodococcus sp. MALMAid1271]|uniref:YciI family protein n=1 Tax=Rhodococcus sp. MALMAid1271 TaxID=3411744 RepID=UPI003B9FBBCB
MPTFVVEYKYSAETSSGRDDHRTDHRAWLRELERRKILRSSRPLADHSGATLIVDGPDKASVERIVAHDPFALANLIEHVRVEERAT